MKPVGETEFVNGVAAMSASGRYGPIRSAAGIVSLADLTLGDACRAKCSMPTWRSASAFKGIRHATGWDASDQVRNSHTNPTEGLLLDATFRKGFAELGKRGLSFDAWLYHPQIPQLTDLARAFPGTTIIVDHFGGPLGIGPYEGKSGEVFAQWKKSFRELAKCPNVVAKLGGIAMPINGFGFHKNDRPATSDELVAASGDYYCHAIDVFGRERCMFESNFPVDKASCSYRTLWNSFKKIAAGCVEGREGGVVSRHRRARISTGIDTEGVTDENDAMMIALMSCRSRPAGLRRPTCRCRRRPPTRVCSSSNRSTAPPCLPRLR